MHHDFDITINLDIVLCMEATGHMKHMLAKVRESAIDFSDNLRAELERRNRPCNGIRIKVIAFRDMTIGDPNEVSKWFSLPSQNADYKAFVDKLVARSGGDGPNTAIDAISQAMMQDWVKTGDVRRHVIVLWTDGPTWPPGEQKMDPQLPKSMPEFVRMWEDPREAIMEPGTKRLFVFAPTYDSWAFVDDLDNACFEEVSPVKALDELEMNDIIRIIAESVRNRERDGPVPSFSNHVRKDSASLASINGIGSETSEERTLRSIPPRFQSLKGPFRGPSTR